jgi:hypothetical protein
MGQIITMLTLTLYGYEFLRPYFMAASSIYLHITEWNKPRVKMRSIVPEVESVLSGWSDSLNTT